MTPTKPNRTRFATASDVVMTPLIIANLIVEHFPISGTVLEPCRGSGNIYSQLREPKYWCEISEGRDFFEWVDRVDWIVTNPPYSIYDAFLSHCFNVADNVVLLVPLQKVFKSIKTMNAVESYGGLREVYVLGSGARCGFAFGFPVGCLHYQRDYDGPINLTRASL